MLQQTQVVTVQSYFPKFIDRFPTVGSLALASLDDVLALWSGLGYYSRARNLHRCAQQIMTLHGGEFPACAQLLTTLPGIGRSTAAAIASLCFGERVAILDANVKRVVTRVQAFGEDLASATNERALWDIASLLLPAPKRAVQQMPGYTQGMMDLGATVCLPKTPLCGNCPVFTFCKAQSQGNPQHYPVRSRKLKRSSQFIWLLWAYTAQGRVWLEKRPAPGVWAGLYCFPLFDREDALRAALPQHLQTKLQPEKVFTHVLTHKDLHLHPFKIALLDEALQWDSGRWVAVHEFQKVGLPAPIRNLLESRTATYAAASVLAFQGTSESEFRRRQFPDGV